MGAASEPSADLGIATGTGRRVAWFVVALAWAGLLVALYLAYRSAHPSLAGVCGRDSACERVVSSRYATLAGIPLAWAGVAFYALVLGLGLAAYGVQDAGRYVVVRRVLRLLALAGAVASGFLLYVQFGVLRAVCPLCTVSAALMIALYFTAERLPASAEARGAPARAAGVALVVAGVTLALATVFVLQQEDRVVARIAGEEITDVQLDREMQLTLHDLAMRAWTAKRDWARAKAESRALADEARRRGVTVADLLDQEVYAGVAVSKAEVDAWLAERRAALSEEERRSRARTTLLTERREARRRAFLDSLPRPELEFLVEAPRVRRVTLDLSTAERDGPADAPIQLVVFSEFRCRHCARLAGVLRRIRERHPEKVALAFLHFPLDGHDASEAAAVASVCASRQGRFWAFHDRLFEDPTSLGEDRLLDCATACGLDPAAFAACRGTPSARALVAGHREQARRLGLRNVPSLFLNGRLVGGALAYDELERLIAEELREPWLSVAGGGD